MNHLYLAAAAQHAAQTYHMSASTVTDVRAGGLLALAGCLFGLYRTVTKPRREARAAAAALPAVEAMRVAAHAQDSAE